MIGVLHPAVRQVSTNDYDRLVVTTRRTSKLVDQVDQYAVDQV